MRCAGSQAAGRTSGRPRRRCPDLSTAVFDFGTTKGEGLDLNLISDSLAGTVGFDSLQLTVTVDRSSIRYKNTFSLSAAENFFAAGTSHLLGTIAPGSGQSIELDFLLSYNPGTQAGVGDGFGFAYRFVDPPAPGGVPELSTWTMMLIGFVGLGYAGMRRPYGLAVGQDRACRLNRAARAVAAFFAAGVG